MRGADVHRGRTGGWSWVRAAALAGLLGGAVPRLCAGNNEARAEFSLGLEQLQAGRPAAAGRHFNRAQVQADDPVLKANALTAAADAFRRAGDPIQEAAALRELTASFAAHADYPAAMRRQYELATRDYWLAVRHGGTWFPWHGQAADRAIAAFESLRQQAPFADFTPELQVRLGRMYLEKNRVEEALRQWRDVIRLHAGAPEERYAWFELANALLQLAANGDGDGAYGREAREVIRTVLEKYPDDPEAPWAREKTRAADTFAARRLYDLADFYRGAGNQEAASRYLHELLATYPKSPVATDAERMLANLDAKYTPPARPDPERHQVVRYPHGKMAEEPVKIIVPAGTDGKWLLPVEDLGVESSETWRKPKTDQELRQ